MKPGQPQQALSRTDKRALAKRVLLTKAMEDEIVNNISAGMFETQACKFAGVDPAVYRQWKKWAEDDIEPYKRFFRRVLDGRNERVKWALLQIQTGAKEWKAAAWWLDRVCPEWREGNRTDEPPQAPPLETMIREIPARFTPEEVQTLAHALLRSDPLIGQLPAHDGAGGETSGDAEEAVASEECEGEADGVEDPSGDDLGSGAD